MKQLLKAKDYIELANVIMSDARITKMLPQTMILHNDFISRKATFLQDKLYCTTMLFNLANELAAPYSEKYDTNVLFDIDLLKFVIYYYVKASISVTDEESDLIVLLNNSKDNFNKLDFTNGYYDQTINVINIHAQIDEFIHKA